METAKAAQASAGVGEPIRMQVGRSVSKGAHGCLRPSHTRGLPGEAVEAG